MAQALVVVVHRHRQAALCLGLTNHILIEDGADFLRRGQLPLDALPTRIARNLFANDVVAQLDALVANENGRAGNELAHFVLALATKRAVKQLFAARLLFRHVLALLFQVSARLVSTLSMRPYSLAAAAAMKLSRSVSFSICSIDWPV
ncbi:hypothetical protein SDC9_144575 [bioreactor metagenome]|uniref:Uncharacterized protein n=1 Tax=bioreactor metagenome TaxID=1076179 RepID=A0A645E9U6_9ZZZZ